LETKNELYNSDASIATSDVLSDDDEDLSNSSDKEHARIISDQVDRKHVATPYKSSTINSKPNELLNGMRQGKYMPNHQ
jgi:hypothetical protein